MAPVPCYTVFCMSDDDDAIWMLRQLEQLAAGLGIEVRYESLTSHDEELSLNSGYCRLKGRQLIIVETTLTPQKRCHVLANELRRFDLSTVFVTPAVRALLAK